MGVFGKLIFVIVTFLVVLVGIAVHNLFTVPPTPHLDDVWWGKGAPGEDDKTIKPFKINVPQQVLDDLQRRLQNHRPFISPLEGIQQQYGMNTHLLNDVVKFWKNDYNWREQEKYLNRFPQFTTQIQGLNIHFLHVKPAVSETAKLKVLPLLLLHGWPGSIREFYEIIPILTSPQEGRNFVFEVIAPSLPGYGFSEAASKPGLGAAQIAVVMKNLMQKLGFEKFYIQGGDWGAIISTFIAVLFPEHTFGIHCNLCYVNTKASTLMLLFGSLYPQLLVEKEAESLIYPISEFYSSLLLEMGYFHLQATKPDTVGVALNDSPVGLASYILEKFTTWTNKSWKEREDGGLKEKYTYTDLLDNVMIYWITGSITTSMRLYSESFNKAQISLNLDSIPTYVPTACAKFRNEMVYTPDSILKLRYRNLVHSADYDDGGHFAAFEVPKTLANDIWTGIQKIEDFNKQQAQTK